MQIQIGFIKIGIYSRRFFFILPLQVEVIEGELVCPESGRKFPITNGIPNMLLLEHEVDNVGQWSNMRVIWESFKMGRVEGEGQYRI